MIKQIRFFLTAISSIFISLTCYSKGEVKNNKDTDKPNIIMILVDDMGYSDLGCYGGEIETPNLDKLAQKGIRFTQMHNTSKCFPSRACLLTGVYAQHCGMGNKPLYIKNAITLGDMLRSAGYRTLASAKHHSTKSLYETGFDRVYGLLDGATNHFNPGVQRKGEPIAILKRDELATWNIDDKVINPYTPPKDYYSTDYYTKYALSFLDEYKNEDKPFFLYLAYTAPHDPLQAWPHDIAKYKGKYMDGYQAVRNARHKKQLAMGIVNPHMELSAQTSRNWDLLSEKEKETEDLKMAVYAAMIDCVDQNIGKLLNKLEALGELENTIIMFASDNGCSSERAENKVGGTGDIGTISYWASLQLDWSNVSNTPYRYHKNSSYEGGICTPFIVSWGNKLKSQGAINNKALHFVDVMPTLIELAGAQYPEYLRGEQIVPVEGESFLPSVLGETTTSRKKPIYWQWGREKAIRYGEWKAVFNGKEWAMFNMMVDRNETNDVKDKNPEQFKKLMEQYDEWSKSFENKN